jgi:signal transduction histidine kinase
MTQYSPSGLRAIPHLQWGSHVTHIFQSGDELRDLLVPYFKTGLENNECCFWVTGKDFTAEEARSALRSALPELERFERNKQIEICDGGAFYGPNDRLHPEELIRGLLQREREALGRGHAGLRTNGNCSGIHPQQLKDFLEYEAIVQHTVRDRRMICMCSYHADQLRNGFHLDLMARHDIVLPSAPSAVLSRQASAIVANHARQQPVAMRAAVPPDFRGDIEAVAAIPAIDTMLTLLCQITGMGFAAVARVTEDRWICCAVKDDIDFGLRPGGELPVETTICNEIRASGRGVAIDCVSAHPHFRTHATPLQYGFESYISVPIVLAGGDVFGTLCSIDPRPAQVDTPKVISIFKLFAALIALNIDNRRRLVASEAELVTERNVAELREQFIAVLGHDLRSPLMALHAGTQVLQRTTLDHRTREVVKSMQSSVYRMSELITNVLDFARGRMGGGLPLARQRVDLMPMLELVTRELQDSHPDRRVLVEFEDLSDVFCDPQRIGQMLSNLLSNALIHGTPDGQVTVRAARQDEGFELSVINQGSPIPAHMVAQLFQPFMRASAGPSSRGLGLGLFIASEIAKAHGGTLKCHSDHIQTAFIFRMPNPDI